MDAAVVHVEVDPVGDDALVLRWETEGEPLAVDVTIGPTADNQDHQHQATVPAGETSLRVARRHGRQFVSVKPHLGGPAVIAAERRIPFERVTNFRDLGGYGTRSGRRVQWGLVFRSDALHEMSDADVATYNQLGLRAAYDLRGEVERAEEPDPMPSRNLPILAHPAGDDSPLRFDGITAEDGEHVLRDLYVGHIEHAAAPIGELFSALADPAGLPAMFHCHAGKDRTGLAAALLLEALGVERTTILDDYELTTRYWLRAQHDESFERLIKTGLAPGAAARVLTAPRWAMASALEYLDSEYGDIERYLTGPAAMNRANIRRLSNVLLTS